MKKISFSLALAAITAIAAFPVHAGVLTQANTVLYTPSSDSNPPLAGFALSPNLMDNATISSTDFFASVGGSSPTVLVPASLSYGTVDWGATNNGHAGASAISGGGGPSTDHYSVTFQLDPAALLGYKLTGINVMSSWDNSISQAQNYDLAYSTAAAPLVFISLGNYTLTGANSTNQSMETSLSGLLMPTDVADLQFTFDNLGTGFTQATRRIEVFGEAVPEPSTWAMLLIGMGALAIGIRRRQIS